MAIFKELKVHGVCTGRRLPLVRWLTRLSEHAKPESNLAVYVIYLVVSQKTQVNWVQFPLSLSPGSISRDCNTSEYPLCKRLECFTVKDRRVTWFTIDYDHAEFSLKIGGNILREGLFFFFAQPNLASVLPLSSPVEPVFICQIVWN